MMWRYRFSHRLDGRTVKAFASAPWAGGLKRNHVELIALASGTDINGSLWEMLAKRRSLEYRATIAALLCVDPFLRVQDRASMLRESGIDEIVNLPSVSLIDGEAGRALTATGYGWERELHQLAQFKAHGFAVSVVVRDARQARHALELDPRHLILHPGLPLPDAVARQKVVNRIVRDVAALQACPCPLLIYRPLGFAAAFKAAGAIPAGSVTLQQSRP